MSIAKHVCYDVQHQPRNCLKDMSAEVFLSEANEMTFLNTGTQCDVVHYFVIWGGRASPTFTSKWGNSWHLLVLKIGHSIAFRMKGFWQKIFSPDKKSGDFT